MSSKQFKACELCGHRIAKNAQACPNCGNPRWGRGPYAMSVLLGIALTLIIALNLFNMFWSELEEDRELRRIAEYVRSIDERVSSLLQIHGVD